MLLSSLRPTSAEHMASSLYTVLVEVRVAYQSLVLEKGSPILVQIQDESD